MKKTLIRLFACLPICLFLAGDIYYWLDDSGTKNYTNVIPPVDQPVIIIKERKAIHEKEISSPQKIPSNDDLSYNFKVLKVFDGDSILVQSGKLSLSVRLIGIDAPELGYKAKKGQPFSRKAKLYLKKRIINRKVALKLYGRDQYNRQLAEVFADGKNLNLEMIRRGLAEMYQGRISEGLNKNAYLQMENLAKKEKQGIWKLGKFYKSPKQWRRENSER